jgi:hypothetical protein
MVQRGVGSIDNLWLGVACRESAHRLEFGELEPLVSGPLVTFRSWGPAPESHPNRRRAWVFCCCVSLYFWGRRLLNAPEKCLVRVERRATWAATASTVQDTSPAGGDGQVFAMWSNFYILGPQGHGTNVSSAVPVSWGWGRPGRAYRKFGEA